MFLANTKTFFICYNLNNSIKIKFQVDKNKLVRHLFIINDSMQNNKELFNKFLKPFEFKLI